MAYLRSLLVVCPDCGKNATVELFDHRNSPYGRFCQRDGNRRLRVLERAELKAHNDPREP